MERSIESGQCELREGIGVLGFKNSKGWECGCVRGVWGWWSRGWIESWEGIGGKR